MKVTISISLDQKNEDYIQKRIKETGRTRSKIINEIINKYRIQEEERIDRDEEIRKFLEENTEKREGNIIRKEDLYKKYKNTRGELPENKFYRKLKKYTTETRRKNRRYIKDLEIREEEKSE